MTSEIPDGVYRDVKQEYLKSVHVPRDKPVRQFLLCPIGLVGAGKTTVIKPLSEKLNLVRISGDDIRKMFKERGYGYDRAKTMTYEIITDFLDKGFSVAIDSDCISSESQEKIEEAKEKYNLKVFWIHINPPEEFILQKLLNYKHTWLFRDGEHAILNYEQRKPLHENLNFNFVYTFDTSREDINKQIEDAAEIILSKIESD